LTFSIKQSVKLLANEQSSSNANHASGCRSRQQPPRPSEAQARLSAQLVCDPRQLSFVSFFFARKESYLQPGRRSPLKPKTERPKPKAANKIPTHKHKHKHI